MLSLVPSNDAARISLAYELVLGRPATPAELQRARDYLKDYEQTAGQILAKQPSPRSDRGVPKENGIEQVAAADPAKGAGKRPKKPVADATEPTDPDNVDQTDLTIRKEIAGPSDPRIAAWASFCQALLGSAEFRYVR